MVFERVLVGFALASCSYAQTSGLFQWGFNLVGSSLQTCTPLSLFVSARDNPSVIGTPPYYMMAFPIGGTPRTYPIGSDIKQLSWTMDYDIGTKLILSVVDADGSAGGVDTQVYTSTQGPSTCIKKDSSSGFTISANVTAPANIQTCDPWAITASGGSPPYTFTLAAIDAIVVTNVTAQANDQDELIYINRASPNTQLLAAVADSTGKFAYGSPVINTQGSSNVDCNNRESALVNSKQSPTPSSPPGGGGSTKKSTPIGAIVGGVLGGLLLLAALIAGLLFLKRRKRQTPQREEVDLLPNSAAIYHDAPYTDYNPYHPMDQQTVSEGARFSAFPVDSSVRRSGTPTMSGSDASTYGVAGIGAGGGLERPTSLVPRQPALGKRQEQLRIRNMNQAPISKDADESDEVIVQHQDAGRVVRELPPPYLYPDSDVVMSWPGDHSGGVAGSSAPDVKAPTR